MRVESHAIKRAQERYGLALTPEKRQQLRRIVRKGLKRHRKKKLSREFIADNTVVGVIHDHGSRVRAKILFGGQWLCVVYDTATDVLVTVLP